jgi:cytochrome c oxidase subunit 2
MSISFPERIWWRPISKEEKIWVIAALCWGIFMFIFMIAWHGTGRQNNPSATYRITPSVYAELTNEFISKYKIGQEGMRAVVQPPAGGDVYMLARVWSFDPILVLKKGESYRLHLSSLDLQHGFSLQPMNLNLQVLPGYDFVVNITPTQAGEFSVICNEFCGVGHHTMVGKIIVKE